MAFENGTFTSESVTEGHPDKFSDKVSDAIVDAAIDQDPDSRVACETACPNDENTIIMGEITTRADLDYEAIVRGVHEEVGYPQPEKVWNFLKPQSQDISQGVTAGEGLFKEQGAGDQGMMFGFATDETPTLMPMPAYLSHRLCERLTEVRKDGTLASMLRADGKSQVSVVYQNGKPVSLSTVVVSAHHVEDVEQADLVAAIYDNVILPVCEETDLMTDDLRVNPTIWDCDFGGTVIYINPTGRFAVGGPAGDSGLTGRKIIVDTYGGRGRHGGGAFSGKDPSKVDRSGAYAARFIAKNIVESGMAQRAEVQLAYVIGVAHPVSINIDTEGTGRFDDADIAALIPDVFPVKPADIIGQLDLTRRNGGSWKYYETAACGHFGSEGFHWESTERAEALWDAYAQRSR